MADVAQAFIQGQQAGQQARLAREQHEESKQENNLRRMMLKLQMDQMKVQEAVEGRKLDQERLAFLEGRPLADLPQQEVPGPWEVGQAPMEQAPISVRAAGGLPEDKVTPRSAETLRDLAQQMARQKYQEDLNKPTIVPDGSQLVAGGKVISENTKETPKSYQQKNVLVDGKPRLVNFDPATGQTIDPQTGQPFTGTIQDAPPQRDPLAQELARERIETIRRERESGRSPKQITTFNQIAGAYERSPLIKAADRTIVLADAAKAIKQDPTSASNQMALAYSYIQALDTYQSAVREGELANLGALGTRLQGLLVEANKVATTGAFMPPAVAKEIADASERLVETIHKGRTNKMREFKSRAKVSGVGQMWDEFEAGMGAESTGKSGGVTVLSIVPVKQ